MQINQYANSTATLANEDYLDVDKFISLGVYQSNKILWSDILSEITSAISTSNIGNSDLTIIDTVRNLTLSGNTSANLFRVLKGSGVTVLNVSGNGSVWNNGLATITTNTSYGQDALISNTTGASVTALGYEALKVSTTGANMVAVGTASLKANTTGSNNVAIGGLSLTTNISGNNNVAVGLSALQLNTASSNTALGFQALTTNSSGSNNVGVGSGAVRNNTTASNLVGVGFEALRDSTGAKNTGLGYHAGRVQTTGTDNVFIGNNSATTITGGITPHTICNQSIFIGSDTKANANNETNQIVIGHNITGLGSNTVSIGNASITKTQLRGTLKLVGLSTYADNASALGGGLVVDECYKTATGELRIVI